MWKRLASKRLRELWKQFPAVLILGARQVGKTTLARETFPKLIYCDLEEPNSREAFENDPAFEITKHGGSGLILDEAQLVPSVFSALRGIIDANRSAKGSFLLLGSAQPKLIRQVSESLAGRAGILELDPMTAQEAEKGKPTRDWKQVWLKGGFPDSLRGNFRDWWEAYLRMYIERDLPHLGFRPDPILTRRILTMLAHGQGGILNASHLGNSLGVSYHTVQHHLDIFESTFLVRRLPPYFRNIGKRLTKAPKVYLRDTGLIHHLLNISALEELDSHPVRGPSWETFVIEDLIRREKLSNPHTQFYYWRTHAGAETDLIIDRGSKRFMIEVKAGSGRKTAFANSLEQICIDVDAANACIIDQAEGTETLRPRVNRRGFSTSLNWLPA